MRRAIWTTIFYVSLLTGISQAADRYASTTGSGTDCTVGTPCSLDTALSGASPGDTVYINSGTYGRPTTVAAGESGNRITIRPVDGGAVVIGPVSGSAWPTDNATWIHMVAPPGTTFKLQAAGTACSNGIVGIDNSILENIEVTGFGSQGVLGVTASQLLNLHIHDGGGVACADEPPEHQHGIYTGGDADQKDNLIDGGSVHDNTGKGIQCYPTCSGTTIRNILVYNNGSDGIYFLGGTGNKVYNAVVYGNGQRGILAFQTEVYNVSVYDNNQGIDAAGAGVIIRNSISLGNNEWNYQVTSGTPTVSNNIFTGTATDYFADATTGNLRLKASATDAIDQGTSISGTFTTDINGVPRPQGTAWDIGAYEFGARPRPPILIGVH